MHKYFDKTNEEQAKLLGFCPVFLGLQALNFTQYWDFSHSFFGVAKKSYVHFFLVSQAIETLQGGARRLFCQFLAASDLS